MSDDRSPEQVVHESLGTMLDDGEIVLRWHVTIDVAGPEGVRYLAHRAGGGHDGSDKPTIWEVTGMLQSSLDVARRQLDETTEDVEDDEE